MIRRALNAIAVWFGIAIKWVLRSPIAPTLIEARYEVQAVRGDVVALDTAIVRAIETGVESGRGWTSADFDGMAELARARESLLERENYLIRVIKAYGQEVK